MRNIARRRMILLQIAPEHVLNAVGRIKDAGAQPLLGFIECIKEHALAIFVIAISLRQKSIIIEHMLIQGPRIFRESERGIWPKKLRQIN